MENRLIKRLSEISGVSDISLDEDYLVEFYLNIDFFKECDVNVIFDDFDIHNNEDQEKIITYTKSLVEKLPILKKNILDLISGYTIDRYRAEIDIYSFINGEIKPTFIRFSSSYSFGNCCLSFNCAFEEEHGIGVKIKHWEPYEIGFSDICFTKI